MRSGVNCNPRGRHRERSVRLGLSEIATEDLKMMMKHLLSSVAILAALAIASPVSAQREGPGPGAATGTGPAVNPPGGPGPSSPLYNLPAGSPGIPGTPQSRYGPLSGQPSAPPPGAQAAPGTAPGPEATTSATPSRHARHHGHVAAHHTTKGIPVSGNPNMSANQMNADELARLQAGNLGNPPPADLPYATPPATDQVGPGRAARRLRNQ